MSRAASKFDFVKRHTQPHSMQSCSVRLRWDDRISASVSRQVANAAVAAQAMRW